MYRNEGLYEETPNLTLCIGNAIFFMVALVLPSISINRSHKLDEESMATDKKCMELVESVLISLDYIYHVLSFITNIIIVLVQCLMILFTVMVGVVWDTKNKKKKQKSVVVMKKGKSMIAMINCLNCLQMCAQHTRNT